MALNSLAFVALLLLSIRFISREPSTRVRRLRVVVALVSGALIVGSFQRLVLQGASLGWLPGSASISVLEGGWQVAESLVVVALAIIAFATVKKLAESMAATERIAGSILDRVGHVDVGSLDPNRREEKVLSAIGTGLLTDTELARELHISVSTVQTHVKRLCERPVSTDAKTSSRWPSWSRPAKCDVARARGAPGNHGAGQRWDPPVRAAAWLMFPLIGLASCAPAVVEASTTSTAAPTTTLVTSFPATSTSVTGTTVAESTTTTDPVSTTTRPVDALTNATIVIDPGHNGMNWAHPEEIGRLVDIGNGTKPCNTTGTSTDGDYTEAQFNWAVAMRVVPLLEDAGAEVILTRPDNADWGPCITERAATGNRHSADAVISIHADGGPADGRGFHVIFPTNTPGLTDDIAAESLILARALHAAYLGTGMPVSDYIGEGGFSERDDLGGLNLSDVPAVFLEAGNMRNPVDAALLVHPEFQMTIARAILEALADFLTD